MKIYKFSRVISIPFALILIWFVYMIFVDYRFPYFGWAILPAAALILFNLFQPQIDYWWLDRNPVEIEPVVLDLIKRTNPIYSNLDEKNQSKFEKRLLLYTEGREFIAKGMERDLEVVYDIKYMLSQIPVTMTLFRKEFLIKQFDRIILYKHAFATPLNKFLHTVETHAEDGVLIVSLEHVEAALFKPKEFYNVGWHGFAEVFVKSYPKIIFPDFGERYWESIEEISGFTKQRILHTVGFQTVDILYVIITTYFVSHEKFSKVLHSEAKNLDAIFKTHY